MSAKPTSEATALGCMIALAGFIILTPVQWAIGGYTLATLWGWFVVSLFGVKALTMPTAAGLLAVTQFVFARKSEKSDDDMLTAAGKMWGTAVWYALYATLTLGMGWVLKTVWL